jgi:pimeloyl-ACP methyl ester carboxylesterase
MGMYTSLICASLLLPLASSAGSGPCVEGCDGQASHCKQCSTDPALDWSCDVCCSGCTAKAAFGGQFCVCTGPTPPPVPTPAPTAPPCTSPTCSPFPIAGQGAVGYRNNCTASKCPLLIMLHGMGGDGEKFAEDSKMFDEFNGIIAYPSSIPFATGWPIAANGDTVWTENLATLDALIALPGVDASRVSVLGFSSGGFYSYALACAMGDRLRTAVVVSALKYVQPAGCPHHTNILHVHSAHDSYNTPTDPTNGTKPVSLRHCRASSAPCVAPCPPTQPALRPPLHACSRAHASPLLSGRSLLAAGCWLLLLLLRQGGLDEIGYPTTLRDNWLDGLPASDVTTNGPEGVTSGDFTEFTAKDGNISFDYYFYLNGPSRHAYIVYDGTPPGAPGGVGMEDFIAGKLNARNH